MPMEDTTMQDAVSARDEGSSVTEEDMEYIDSLVPELVKELNEKTSPRLPFEIVNLTPNNIGQLRKLNSVVFPVRYPEAFYKDVLADNVRDFCKLAYYQSTCVGAICCKVVPPAKDGKDSKPSLYIQCLGVLAPYRRRGLATLLLQTVTSPVVKNEKYLTAKHTFTDRKAPPVSAASASAKDKKDREKQKAKAKEQAAKEKKEAQIIAAYTAPSIDPATRFGCIRLHVHTRNTDAKEFYEKLGYIHEGTDEQYYTRLNPPSAWILCRSFE